VPKLRNAEPTTAQLCRSETQTFILEDLFGSVLSQFKKYYPSGNMKFNNLGIFQSFKLRILIEKILPISLKQNCTPNTLGCYGLIDYFSNPFPLVTGFPIPFVWDVT